MVETWQGRNEVAIPADGQEGSLHIFAFIYIYIEIWWKEDTLMKRTHLFLSQGQMKTQNTKFHNYQITIMWLGNPVVLAPHKFDREPQIGHIQ